VQNPEVSCKLCYLKVNIVLLKSISQDFIVTRFPNWLYYPNWSNCWRNKWFYITCNGGTL